MRERSTISVSRPSRDAWSTAAASSLSNSFQVASSTRPAGPTIKASLVRTNVTSMSAFPCWPEREDTSGTREHAILPPKDGEDLRWVMSDLHPFADARGLALLSNRSGIGELAAGPVTRHLGVAEHRKREIK